MSWFDKLIPPGLKWSSGTQAKKVPEGVWVKCPSCETVLYSADLDANQHVCPNCHHHLRIGARRRLDLLLDPEHRESIADQVLPADPLRFRDSRKYSERLDSTATKTGESEALLVMAGSILSLPVVVAAFDFDFMGGSMGSVVGERFRRGVQEAVTRRLPFVSVAASGGARMQEGLFSLMQMAKTTASLTALAQARLPYVSVLTDPTMGGVSASFCFLGDVVIAEPGALVGFAGQRVIEQTVREKLPEGFQRAEFLLDKGAIDMIVERRHLRREIASLLALLQKHPADALIETVIPVVPTESAVNDDPA